MLTVLLYCIAFQNFCQVGLCIDTYERMKHCCIAASGPKVLHTFPKAEDVRGVTLLNNELYVLRQRHINQVDIYSATDFNPLRPLSVPGLESTCFTDLASCAKQKCLYMSDFCNSCIHRVGLDHSVRRWLVQKGPWGLKVTRNGSLLVTCSDEAGKNGKLIELVGDSGKPLREVTLQADIVSPWHATLLDNGRYLVCHGYMHTKSRLTQDTGEGKVIGSNTGELKEPRHLAVDDDGFVLVADSWNDRIAVFDPSLNYVCDVMGHMPSRPERLCFDEVTRRLYVGQSGGVIIVVQLDNGIYDTRV